MKLFFKKKQGEFEKSVLDELKLMRKTMDEIRVCLERNTGRNAAGRDAFKTTSGC
jgi:hypothetical protein